MTIKYLYLDDNNNLVDESKSTHTIIQEYDDAGNLTNETFVDNRPDRFYDKHNERLTDDDFNRMLDEAASRIRSSLRN